MRIVRSPDRGSLHASAYELKTYTSKDRARGLVGFWRGWCGMRWPPEDGLFFGNGL